MIDSPNSAAAGALPDSMTVGLIGLGLIGGSLARDLAAAGHSVVAYDADPETLAAAVHARVVDTALDASLRGLASADMLILATPVDVAPAMLEAAAPHLTSARLVSDVGSTKRAVQDAAVALGLGSQFVGAHPLAGEQRSGWAVARAGLFDGALAYLCPAPDASGEARRLARGLWHSVGARTCELDADEHDRLLAWTSHMPQAASTALARTLDAAGITLDDLGSGGRGMTRLAGSSPTIWTGIALTNARPLGNAIAGLEHALGELRAGLEAGSMEPVREFFEDGLRWTAQRADPAVSPASAHTAAGTDGPEPSAATRPASAMIRPASAVSGSAAGLVAFQGEPGAFSEEAALRFFGAGTGTRGHPGFADVARAVVAGATAYGVLPIENTVAGSIVATYDLLVEYELTVVGEVVTPVRHCLLALPGARLDGLIRVISHPVALAQCTHFLAAHPHIEAVARPDTAGAAREVAGAGDPDVGAIASRRAAELYELDVLAADIQDREDNQTRFLVVTTPARARAGATRPGDPRPGRRKTALVAETPNTPGALLSLLQPFAARSINLAKLESRPTGEPWTYRFFFEVEADADEPAMEAALGEAAASSRIRVLGSYAARLGGTALD